MLIKAGVALLLVWLVARLGMPETGHYRHILFLAGLMLVLLGVLKGREAAERRARGESRDV